MTGLAELFSVQVLAILVGSALSSAAVSGVTMHLIVRRLDREIYGDDRDDRGLLDMARANRQRSRENRIAIEREGILDGGDK